MKLLQILIAMVIVGQSIAADFLVLQSGQIFEGEVERLGREFVEFSFEGSVYSIPIIDVRVVEMAAPTKRERRLLSNFSAAENACFKGSNDGALHGHGGGHFIAGALTGVFGVIGCAVTTRTPAKSNNIAIMSGSNKDLWNNSEYLNCYNKAAKSKAVTNSLLGWGTWILLALL